MNTTHLDKLARRGADFLGARYPYICGAMTWVSNPELVAAVSNAGGFASLAAGNAPVEVLREEILATRRLTDRPFGVNVITLTPAYQEHLELVREMEVSHVILAGGLPHVVGRYRRSRRASQKCSASRPPSQWLN